MSALEGLEYISYAVEASPGWQRVLHEPHHRVYGPGGATRYHHVGSDDPPVEGTAELIAEQGDTLTILITGDDPPKTVALTVLSPTVAEMTITRGADWARCVVALIALPDAQHEH